ncbi:hypothetical protein RHGRI_028257 [Rhododendron griersonianum]|uniref:Uncharacterized protein n=1 Tax=Rhododendron griersonianum TaxID=479676 RepID=A0AAV6IFR8_9ERIC|nr:hypothetical protein RHGRI_028257 [Rhododendron griersonianum]
MVMVSRANFLSSLEFKDEINGILYILQMSTLQYRNWISKCFVLQPQMSTLQYRKLDFEVFCAAAISVHQLEGMESWEQHARSAYELFEKDGNRPTMTEEFALELGLSPSVPVHVVLQDWIRQADSKLSFMGFVRLLHGVSSPSFQKA